MRELTYFNPISIIIFFLTVVFVDISAETRKTRRNLIAISFVTLVLHAYEEIDTRIPLFDFASSEDQRPLIIAILAAIALYSLVYFSGLLLRDYKIAQHALADDDLYEIRRRTELSKANVETSDDKSSLPKIDNAKLFAALKKRNTSIPYGSFSSVVEIGFPLWLGYSAVRLSSPELIVFLERIKTLVF